MWFKSKIINWILSILGFEYSSGTLTVVASGSKKIKVHTCFMPKRVWINPSDYNHHSCGDNLDKFDVYIVHDGFVIVIDLKSDSRTFNWLAEK